MVIRSGEKRKKSDSPIESASVSLMTTPVKQLSKKLNMNSLLTTDGNKYEALKKTDSEASSDSESDIDQLAEKLK